MKEMEFLQQHAEDDNGGEESLEAIFFNEFPTLPDFPTISSSSSSSTPVAGLMASCSTPSSSSSASSWGKSKHETAEENATPPPPPPAGFGGGSEGDCMEMRENFEYMDLDDPNDLWDPSSIFEDGDEEMVEDGVVPQQPVVDDELRAMFFEWLKSNKGKIAAEDMRKIKLKRSTIESAYKRLGNSVEGKKQLLKLILEWVENFQLRKKQLIGEAACEIPNPNSGQYGDFVNNYLVPPAYIPPPPRYGAPTVAFSPVGGYGSGNRYLNGTNSNNYHVLQTAQTWPPANHAMVDKQMQIQRNRFAIPSPAPACKGNGNEYPCQTSVEKLVRWDPTATKEARKNRMAQQKRHFTLHRPSHQNQSAEQQDQRGGGGGGTAVARPNSRNWPSWRVGGVLTASTGPAVAEGEAPSVMDQPLPVPNKQRQITPEKGEEPRNEKNVKILLQKMLKQSDVGNLGRIVLPKREAEAHLPYLQSRDGIHIAMEDIVTSRVWDMRYRFWPNNKSRMYLLENTGDFVRENRLQEGDFIVIYADAKYDKYFIRAVKLPPALVARCEPVKKPAKNRKIQQTEVQQEQNN